MLVNVPNLLRITASGIDLNWFNNYDPAKHGGAAKPPLFTITTGTITLPSFNVSGAFTGLVVDEHFFRVADFTVTYTPTSGPIRLGSILEFNDLRVRLHNFEVDFTPSSVTVSGQVLIASGGVQFLKGMAVHGSILDGPDADTEAISLGVEFADDGSAKAFVMDVDQLSITFGSFLTISAEHFKLNTGAGPTEELAELHVGRCRGQPAVREDQGRGPQLRVPRQRHVRHEAGLRRLPHDRRAPRVPTSSGRTGCRSRSPRSGSSGLTSRPTRATSS